MRALAAAALALTLTISALPADAQQSDLQRARSRANAAAADLAEAQTRLAELEGEIAALESERAATESALTTLQSALRSAAVQRYMAGGDAGDVGGLGLDLDALRSVRGDVLARLVAAGSEDAIDEYRAAAEDLAVATERTEAAKAEQANVRVALQKRVAAAQAELQKLERLEAERKAAEARKRAEAARAARTARGRSGSGGGSGRPRSFAPTGSWMCPVQGPRAFTNDWGMARSGGRRHQGTDILSPRGTPVVASVSGSVRQHNSRLGGVSYYLHGDDGNTYYGAHLSGYSGATGRVTQGTVIGYVGNTGNARGGPNHLHFEIHPGGGRAVNPYPTLATYC